MSTHNTIQLDEKLTKETVDSKDGKPAKSATQIDDKLHWYKDAIIYELHIKAFRDGNKDGIGDFEGLMEKLDYLQSLGVTAIWLLPFYPSPLRDDGYDIADYYTINPAYGNIEQFKNFLDEAHSRNLKVITELVVNHTSDQHPWFQRARKAPKNSPYRNYYVWTDDRNQYKDVRIIFQDFEASNWTWDNEAQQYYWHRFFHHQPDLNFDNPAVQQEIFNVLEYWCELGVDGFRLDAVPYLFERDGTNCENLNETHSFLKKLRAHVDKHYPGTLLLAEANMWPEDSASYFGKGDECHMNYHFPLMPRMFMAVQMEDRYPIIDILDQTPEIPEVCQWAIFLRNHDELTLEMVTDEERDYMYRVYVKDPRARINLGIRHRLAPLMENDRKKIELMNYLLFSLPGTPVLYYGDEIGMGDNYYLGDRDGVRTPMQWSSDRNAGFSEANPQKLYLPVIQDPLYQYEWVNVEIQSANSSSLLWWMRRLIQVRKKYKAFSRGDIKFINVENPKIFAFTRNYEDETILVVVNLSRFPQPAELDLSAYKGYQVMEIFSKAAFPSVKNDPYFFTLGQYEAQWYVLQPVQAAEEKNISIHLHGATEMKELMKDKNREKIESIVLPQYMMKRRWFGGKAREMSGIKIVDHVELTLPEHHALLLLVEVSYMSGLPDTYLLPVTVASGTIADNIRELSPAAVICDVIVEKQSCLLYDALYCTDLQQYILWQMANNNTISSGKNRLEFTGTKALERYLKEKEGTVKSKVLTADQSNTSIIFDTAFFLKIYRKVDRAMNPDVEISQFLTGAKFNHIPSYVGSITWTNAAGSMALGMMQEMVDNTLDGWTYMLDKLKNYYERIQVSGPGTEELQWPEESGICDTTDYEHAPEELKKLIEANVADKVHLLGLRTAEMHLALASSHDNKDFNAEPFSLHYQRSLFSAFLSLVRKTFQNLEKSLGKLTPEIKAEAEEVLRMKDKIMLRFRHIYHKKMDALKIRVHGDYHLGQILFTGNDLVILDFEGEPAHSFSERRLKKSPLRDVAGMMRSLHYAAYGELLLNSHQAESDINKLTPFADIWYHYMSGFYLESYLKTIKDSDLIPGEIADLEIMLGTYTLEKAIYELNYELNNRPDWVIIPIRGIKAIMQKPSVLKYDS